MKTLAQIVILLLAVYGGYSAYEDFVKPPPVAPQSAAVNTPSEPASASRRITCPACKGEGKLTYVDKRGAIQGYSCPICGFRGYNTISMPKGAYICPECEGMGKTAGTKPKSDAQDGFIVDANRCMRCNSAGWILPRSAGP